MGAVAQKIEAELALWADPEEVGTPDGRKRFDVCDLRIWLKLVDAAGVPAVPATEVASLSEGELEALVGFVEVPAALRDRISKGLAEGAADGVSQQDAESLAVIAESFFQKPISAGAARAAYQRIESALDDIPSSWMVRTQYSGSTNLKALVGAGLMGRADDTAKVRPDFELGGGWVRVGNRRLIDVTDPRFIELAVGGHKPGVTYLARPWAQPGRFHEGDDIHRRGTPLAGPGRWPAEWRVFVRAGVVTGVANYYSWSGGGATPENAWNAIQAGVLAQKIVSSAESMGMVGQFMDQVMLRDCPDKELREILEHDWPEDRLSCSLDFIETADGLRFLEGGPSHAPGGGAHPCAFAGQGVTGEPGRSAARCEGVAYRNMPHVSAAEPSTWKDGDPKGCIHDWDQAAELAAAHAALDEEALAFLEERGIPLAEPDMAP